MKLMSFIEENDELIPVEVELELWPGLPDIHFLGRADAHLKEAGRRIKSAIRSQGFEFPIAQQILVNLRPSHLKKSSRGLELAVAAAYLMATEQVPRQVSDSKSFFYGELSLTGEIDAPTGVSWLKRPSCARLITGRTAERVPFDHHRVSSLQDLREPKFVSAEPWNIEWRPDDRILDLELPLSLARLFGVIALGRHAVLLAGSSGAGKTTAAHILHALQERPTGEDEQDLVRASRGLTSELSWRPFVQPHHKIPVYSMLGGGPEAHGGELARADHGVLLFDEFLEFSSQVLESLREPLEQKRMRVSRGSRVKEYPVRAHFVATTNLCPCGEFVPGRKGGRPSCRFSLSRCRSYAERFSGPLLDRFELLILLGHKDPHEPRVAVREVAERLDEIRTRLSQEGRLPGFDSLEGIRSRLEPWLVSEIAQIHGSERRRIATLRVAQSFSDWEGSPQIKGPHFQSAHALTVETFNKLRLWDL